MCVRILFVSFEELVIRQSHKIKETLREKKSIDLYLPNKSKITEQLCRISPWNNFSQRVPYCLQTEIQVANQKIGEVNRREILQVFLQLALALVDPLLNTGLASHQNYPGSILCRTGGQNECSVVSYIHQSSRERERWATFLKYKPADQLSYNPELWHSAASALSATTQTTG